MSGLTFLVLLVVTVAFIVTIGSMLVKKGYKKDNNGDRNPKLIVIGWIIIGVSTLAGTILFFVVAWLSGYLFGLGLLMIPLLILAGIIVSLTLGVSNLVNGYTKNENGKRNYQLVISGWILLGLNITIVAAIFTLFMLFATGVIPIVLM